MAKLPIFDSGRPGPVRAVIERCSAALLAVVVTGLSGCREEPAAPAGAAAAVGSAIVDPSAVQQEAQRQHREAVERSVNPKKLPPYSGALATVKGVVKVTGDAPPLQPEMIAKLPPDSCPRAHEFERKLFREGADRTLADVLVTVTEYQGFIAPASDAVKVEIKGCAFDARVIAFTFGQRLDVYNLDNGAFMPRLVGTPSYALRVAMPGGPPVPIFAPRAGPFILADQTHEYVRADVFVLNYPTVDVTGLDGRFEITGVPAGSAKVTAFVPAFGKVLEQRVELAAAETKELSFEFSFSESEYRERSRAASQADPGKTQTSPAEPAAEREKH